MGFILVAWALINCLAGYAIFRVLIVVYGLLAGVAGGYALAWFLRSPPSGLDCFVACGSLAILLGLLAWLLYRVAFAMAVFVLLVYATIRGIGTSPGVLVVAALAGLSAAVAAFIYARHAVIFLTAVAGAAQACFFTASLIVGGREAMWRAMARSVPLTAVLVCLVSLLALAGMYCQSRIGSVLRISLAPEAPAGRKGRRRRGVVRPRPTKS